MSIATRVSLVLALVSSVPCGQSANDGAVTPSLGRAESTAGSRRAWTDGLPDVVVFVVDDVAAADVAIVDTPNIDGLAAQGTGFTRGYAQPMCAPARYSLMLSTWRGGNAGFACSKPGPTQKTLPHGIDSLPKLMEGAGYRTALLGRWALGTTPIAKPGTEDYAFTPHLWGFESWLAGVPDGVAACLSPATAGYSSWLRVDNGIVQVSTTYQTIALCQSFEEWWLTTPGPRFAFVALQAAHKGGALDEWHIPPPGAMPPGYVPPPGPTDREKYEAMVQSADHAIGQMMASVDLTRTFVIVVADNGTPPPVAPPGVDSARVKFSTYEGGVRVPFAIAGLGFPAGRTSARPVSIVDIAPTLADLVGFAPRHDSFDGQSLLPALFGEPLARSWIYVQQGDGGDAAVIEERWKLKELGMGLPNGTKVQRLFDLLHDPDELQPRDPDLPEYGDIVLRLRAALATARQ